MENPNPDPNPNPDLQVHGTLHPATNELLKKQHLDVWMWMHVWIYVSVCLCDHLHEYIKYALMCV